MTTVKFRLFLIAGFLTRQGDFTRTIDMVCFRKLLIVCLLALVALAVLSVSTGQAQCPPALTFTGEAVGDLFGFSVSGAGDVNNDGKADLIVGAFYNDAGGTDAGRAYVYSGETGGLLYTFTGEAVGDRFGVSVSGAGDVNNDGKADLIVGAYRNDAGGSSAGRAYVYSGATGGLLYTFTGEAADDYFGVSVSGAGDVNNDGYVDLIVGALYNDAGGTDAGRAYVYSGETGALLYTFTGEASGDWFGYSVSGAGDVNNDGKADLIVGAAYNDAGGSSAGRAYVYSGQTGALLYTFTGEAAGDFFGVSVSGSGDVNNDGYVDLIVGAYQNGAGGSSAGRAYVYSGATGGLLYTFTGEAAYDYFGVSVSGAGDVNNDGKADLIVGAYQNGAGGSNAGRAYVYTQLGDVCDGCCGEFTTGQTGNTNCDDEGKRNLADITRLIDNVYISKVELCCPENGNINGDPEGKTNLADITRLIDHVYISKAETAPCE